MKPTLVEGDRIVVEKLTKFPNVINSKGFINTPQRGDVMIFYPPFVKLKTDPWSVFSRLTGFFCKDIAYIKRVIGLPGEEYSIKPDDSGVYHVYINGKILPEEYVKSDYSVCTEDMHCGPEVIPEGQYLMLGDNRDNSKDGRYWGLLPKERFIGRATFRFWPFTRVKHFKHLDYGNFE